MSREARRLQPGFPMRPRFALLPLVAVLAALASAPGCAGRALRTAEDPAFDLERYATYAWIDDGSADALRLENPPIDYSMTRVTVERNPNVEGALKAEIDEGLAEQGYRRATPGAAPDFYVTYYGRAKDGNWVSTWAGRPPGFDDVPVVAYPQYDRSDLRDHGYEDVAVVFYDARTGKPVWTGTIPSVIGGKSVDRERVASLLHDLFKELPGADGSGA